MRAAALARVAVELMPQVSRALAGHEDERALELLERLGELADVPVPVLFAVEAFAALRQ